MLFSLRMMSVIAYTRVLLWVVPHTLFDAGLPLPCPAAEDAVAANGTAVGATAAA